MVQLNEKINEITMQNANATIEATLNYLNNSGFKEVTFCKDTPTSYQQLSNPEFIAEVIKYNDNTKIYFLFNPDDQDLRVLDNQEVTDHFTEEQIQKQFIKVTDHILLAIY